MRLYHVSAIILLIVKVLLIDVQVVEAQNAAPTQISPVPSLQGQTGVVKADTIATRKATIQARIEALEGENRQADELDATRKVLDQTLKVLTALEVARQKRETYVAQTDGLAQRLQAAEAELKAFDSRTAPRFPHATEALRDQYEAALHAIRKEIEELHRDAAAGEVRITAIAKELDQLAADRVQLEKELQTARSDVTKATEGKAILTSRVELLELRLQLSQAEEEALKAEREWLVKRAPLSDVRLRHAQARLEAQQQALEMIKQALGQVLREERAKLSDAASDIEESLEKTDDPVQGLVLTMGLETVEIQKITANFRQRINQLSDRLLAQEKRNSQEKQDVERLTSLVEKYTGGEQVAQHLRVAFEHLRRERSRYRPESVKTLENQLSQLDEQSLVLDDRLYTFDRTTKSRLDAVRFALEGLPSARQQAAKERLDKVIQAQKAALRDQQQALIALSQETAALLTLLREHKRLLDDGHRFVLTKMFWLRDGRPMGWDVIEDALVGIHATVRRLENLMTAQGAKQHAALLGLIVMLVLTWTAARIRGALRRRFLASSETYGQQVGHGHELLTALPVIGHTMIWPLYVVLVGWLWMWIVPVPDDQATLRQALMSGLYVGACILWLTFVGRALFGQGRWGETYWEFSSALCRFMRRTTRIGWIGAFLLLVPRHVLLMAPGEPESATASLALARLCFTLFQVLLLLLLGIISRRNSPLVTTLLADSQRRHGILWRNWPLIYVSLIGGVVAIMVLDLLGYRYAAQSLWRSSGEALLVALGLLLLHRAVNRLLTWLAHQHVPTDSALPDGEAPTADLPSRQFLIDKGRQFVRLIFIVLGVIIILGLFQIDSNLFETLDSFRLMEAGKGEEGQLLWLTLSDLITAVLTMTGAILLLRNLPSLYEVVLFPRLTWDQGLRYAFLSLSRYGLFMLAAWWALTALHFRWSSIQWILAAISVGLGFGLQEIVGNFVSGIILLTERPVSVGDLVSVGTQVGRVTRITIRATTIQNLHNQTVIIPNKSFITQDVVNWTLGDTKIRAIVPIQVAYGSDIELVEQLLYDVVNSHPSVLQEPPPNVYFTSFGDSALNWEVRFLVPSPQERFKTTHEILRKINQTFQEHGVEIPFPQHDLHIRSLDVPLPLPARDDGERTSAAASDQVTKAPKERPE